VTSDDFFFYAAKIFGWFLKVDNLLVLGVIVTIALFWNRRYKVARRATIALAVAVIFFSNLGISYAALRTLEDRYPIPEVKCSKEINGVIVLGGGMRPGLIPEQRQQPQLGEAGERLTKALELLNKCPDFKLIYSTFSGSLRPEGMSEAESAKQFFTEQRISESRMIFENSLGIHSRMRSFLPRLRARRKAGSWSPQLVTCHGLSPLSSVLAGR